MPFNCAILENNSVSICSFIIFPNPLIRHTTAHNILLFVNLIDKTKDVVIKNSESNTKLPSAGI